MPVSTGLYGWIRSNDGRSAGLFVGFALIVQCLAALALAAPLLLLDADHAPFIGWSGYLARYAPLVLVGSVFWFAAQLWWYMETVKRAVGFRFIDDADEPRLCRLIEPLVILAGLPAPFVGVIDSDARNAFACGIARRKAVVVVTRGLLDSLDDAELTAVLAHELSHVRNGDIRLMAAANIFMATLGRLHNNSLFRFTPVHGLIALAIPPLLPLSVAGGLLGALALRAGQVSRLLIASSREFIADAQAAEWSRNPAALASALLKIDGRHRVARARAEDDAMMIAGESHGPGATHPTAAQRVAALARVTGTMVFNAPGAPRDADWTATTSRQAVERAALGRRAVAVRAIARVRQGSGENLLGLTRLGTRALMLTIAGLAVLHRSELSDGRAMAARFDPRPLAAMARAPVDCGPTPALMLVNVKCRLGDDARESAASSKLASVSYRGQSGRLPATMILRSADGSYGTADGDWRFGPPKELVIAETDRVGCFVRDPRAIERTGALPLNRYGRSGQSIAGLHRDAAELAREVQAGSPEAATVTYYLERRENLVDEAYTLYGQEGLSTAQSIFDDEQGAAAIERLRWIATTSAVARELAPVQQAKFRALLRDPDSFVPCRSLGRPPPIESGLLPHR